MQQQSIRKRRRQHAGALEAAAVKSEKEETEAALEAAIV